MKVFQLSSDVKPYPTVTLKLFNCNGWTHQKNLTYIGRCFFCKCWGHWHGHHLQI